MTPIAWLVNPPAPPKTPNPAQKLYVRRINGEYVEQSAHKRELDDAVLAALVRISPACVDDLVECLPAGMLTQTGRVYQCAEVTVSLRRLYRLGHVWRDGGVWGVE